MKLATFLVPAACALVLGASPALAQDYGRYADQPSYSGGPPERVEVSRPRLHFKDGHLGRSTERVSETERLQMSARELSTPWGAYKMKVRVRAAADDICSDLREHIPYAYDNYRTCYRNAVYGGMRSADAAIERARYEGD